MEDHAVHQTEHMTTIEASAVSQQVQQVHLSLEPNFDKDKKSLHLL